MWLCQPGYHEGSVDVFVTTRMLNGNEEKAIGEERTEEITKPYLTQVHLKGCGCGS